MSDLKSAALIFLSAFCLCVILTVLLIPALKKLRAGQYILTYVEVHKNKSGTPTMGGLAFIISAIITVFLFIGFSDKEINLCIAVGFSYMIVGFLDDFIKIRFKENKGLKAYQKLIFQVAIATIASLFAYFNSITEIYIPILDLTYDLKIWYVPIAVFLFLAFTNCVNLTDGLDGLAGSTSFIFFIFMGIFILAEKQIFYTASNYTLLSFALSGSLLAFLLFNTNKASLFMGDTGSLSLGAFAAAIGILSGNMLILPVLGIMYALSGISVILQVLFFKKTGKRIFLMAPLHHHFQMKGFSEAKITFVYTAVTALAGFLILVILL